MVIDEHSAIMDDDEAMFDLKKLLDMGYSADDIYIGASFLEFESDDEEDE